MKRSKRRWLRRLAVLVVLMLALVGGSIAVLSSDFFADQVRRMVIAQGSAALGEDLHVQDLDIQLWPLSIEARGIQAHSRDPLRPGQEILHVERVAMEGIRLRGAGRIEVTRLVVSRPRVRLRVGNGELRDFPGLRKPGRGSRPSRLELFLAELALEDGAISVTVDRPDLAVIVEGLETTLTNSADDAAEAHFQVRDVRLRVGQVEESVVLESGQLHRRGDRFAMEGYRLVSESGGLSLSGELFLSPKDDKGAIVGALGYDIDAVADLDLAQFSEGNPALPSMAGIVDLHARARGVDADVRVDGMLEMSDGRFARHVIGDAEARVAYGAGEVELQRLWVGTAGGEVTGTGHVKLGDQPTMFADLQLDGLQLAEVFENNTLPGAWVMLGVNGTVRLDGAFDDGMQLAFDVDLPVTDLRVLDSSFRDRPFNNQMLHIDQGRIVGHVEVLSDRTLLQDMKVLTTRSDLDVEVEFIYHKPLILDIRIDGANLSLDDIGAVGNLPFAGEGPTTAHIYGLSKDLQIDAHTRIAEFGMWDYRLGDVDTDVYWHARDDLILENLSAVLDQTTYTGAGRVMFGKPIRVEGSVDIDGGRIEDVVGVFTDRLDLSGQFDGGIRIAGPVRELGGDVWLRGRRVSALGEEFSSIQLSATGRQGRFTFTDAWFRKGKGGVYGRGFIDTHGPMDLEIFSYGLDLAQVNHLAESPLTAILALDVHLWGTLTEPMMHGHAHLSETQYARAGLGDSLLDVTLRDGRLRVNGTLLGQPANRLTGELSLRGRGDYEFGLVWRALPLHLLLPARSLARSPIELLSDGSVEGRGHFKGEPDHHIEVDVTRLDLERGDDRLAASGPITMVYDRDRLTLDEVRLEGPGSDLSLSGVIGPQGRVQLTAGGEVSLALVDIFVPTLKRCEADRTRVELSLDGVWPPEDLAAAVAIDGGSIRVDAFPHPVEVDHGRFALRDGVIRVEAFEGRLGGGRIEGFEGSTIELSELRPRSYDVHARCVDCTVRYPSMLPWTRATADMTLSGTPPMVTLSGDIAVEDMTYREDFNWQSSIINTPARRTRREGNGEGKTVVGLDLRVHSDGGFGISNNLGQARASGELRVIGDTSSVGVDGELETTGGRAWFRGHDFDLTGGTLGFPDPMALDPQFHLELDTDVSTREQRYSIHYDIDGRLSDVGGMQIAGRSDPQLSDADINALLLFGVTTDELQGLASSSDMAALAAQGGNILFGYIMEQVREAGGEQNSALPDRVELVPDYSSSSAVSDFRLVVGKDLVRNRLSGEFYWNFREDFGFGLDWRVGRNLYLVPTWFRTSDSSLGAVAPLWDFGDASLDVRWVIEGD